MSFSSCLYLFVVSLSFLFSSGFSSTSDCTEIINVLDVNLGGADCDYFGFPCDGLEGDYYFTGYDDAGNPRYSQLSTGAFFSVYVETWDPTKASLAFTYMNDYFKTGWDHHADVEFVTSGTCDLFEVQYGALTGATNIIYYPTSGVNIPPVYISAVLNDCTGIALDIGPAPTPYPTRRPTNNPVGGITCPNYDHTIYANCNSDPFCSNCQPWGCAQCVSGYYKMGNEKRCQSCTQNYPNCQQCGDWNGCTACNAGYTLGYEAACNDEICR